MKAMKEIVKQAYPKVIAIRCSAQNINLVENEVASNNILKQLVEDQKYFISVHLEHALLKEEGCLAAIWWNSNRLCDELCEKP